MQDNKEKYSLSFFSMEPHQTPEFKEDKRKDYIIFGTDKEWYNRYPNYLLDNYEKSAVHNSICNGKINYTVGNGLEIAEYNTPKDLASAKACLKSINEYEDADSLNRKLSSDLIVFGGFFVEVIQSNDGGVGGYYHISFADLRRDKEDETKWYYTCDWSSRKPEQNDDFKEFYLYEGEFASGRNYIMEYRIYRAGDYPYALPDYMAANAAIETDWRITNFLLNNVKNGFSAGFLINFYDGQPEEEEKKVIERKIKEKFTGDSAGGSFVLNFSHAEAKSAEIIPIPTNGHDDRFTLLDERVNEKLFTAHNVVSPMLFGVRAASQLGGRNEMIEAFELMQNTYTANRQALLEKFWDDAMMYKEVDARLRIKETTPYGETEEVNEIAVALGSLSPLVATKILDNMTTTEIRALIGLKGSEIKTETKTFNAEDLEGLEGDDLKIVQFLSECGVNDEEFDVVYKRGIMAGSIAEAMEFQDVTTNEAQLLSLLRDNPNTPVSDLAEALGLTDGEVMDMLENLQSEGYISLKDGEVEITEQGLEEASNEETLIVYKYALRPDAPPLKGESRPFCRALMSLSATRSWTIDDIKRMNNGQGLDVFTHRGGWYNLPNTSTRVPYCRHRWVQQLVRIRR